MDFRLLESDELDVEYVVRKIDPMSESAFDRLVSITNLEQAGKRDKPTIPHPIQIPLELEICKRKVVQLSEAFVKFSEAYDPSTLRVLRVRTVHLVNRLERLRSHAGEEVEVPLLLENARRLVERFTSARSEQGFDEDQELEGFDCLGAAVPPSQEQHAAMAASRSTVNAHANTATNPSKRKQTPAGQLLSWNIDPSIMASGTRNRTNNRVTGPRSLSAFVSQAEEDVRQSAINDFPSHSVFDSRAPRSAFINNPQSLQMSSVQSEAPVGHGGVLGRNRLGLTHILSKWTARFSGSAKDLPIDEFFFRVENLAAADNIHADSLVLGLHCLLTGNASDFYWVQRRKNPNHTWAMLKRSMIAHFARQETDLEIRKIIMGRCQAASEGFGEFSLAVECLAARLVRPMNDAELVDIMRQNMSPRLQTCLLMTDTPTVESLKGFCRRYERLWASQAEAVKDRRINRHMAALGFDEFSGVDEVVNPSLRNLSINESVGSNVNSEYLSVEALGQAKPHATRTEYMICWNCDDIGHSFIDCSSPDRKVFCYGCGAKNAYKPSCSKCNPGNAKSSGIISGRSRSTPNPFTLHHSNSVQSPK